MDWTTPFKWAFEVGMWGIGIFLLTFVAMMAALFIYALVKGFGAAFRSIDGRRKSKGLSSVE